MLWNTLLPTSVVAALLTIGPASLPDTTVPPTAPPVPPVSTAPAAPDPTPAPVLALLDDLERSADDLHGFTASIVYRTREALLGQTVTRSGRVLYTMAPGTRARSFAILFDWEIDEGKKTERLRHYVFRDGWLVEIDHANQQFVKRQIAAPGESFDPLKLGEGPIPIPIGQPRDQVVSRFDVTLIELPTEGLLAKLRGQMDVDGLRLVPLAGTTEAEDYAHIDLFYDRVTRLPAGVSLLEHNGDRKQARLTDLRRNPVLDAAALAHLDIEPPAGDWRIDIRRLER